MYSKKEFVSLVFSLVSSPLLGKKKIPVQTKKMFVHLPVVTVS